MANIRNGLILDGKVYEAIRFTACKDCCFHHYKKYSVGCDVCDYIVYGTEHPSIMFREVKGY